MSPEEAPAFRRGERVTSKPKPQKRLPKRLRSLGKLLQAFMERRLRVVIIPQCSDDHPWEVEISVPCNDGEVLKYFGGPILEDALRQALEEYDKRIAAKKVLS